MNDNVDDWDCAEEPPSTEASAMPYNRTALPGTQNEHFEQLFHLEKLGQAYVLRNQVFLPTRARAQHVVAKPLPVGWDESLEELSIVTLCPNEESWDRLRAWIEQYSTNESRRPWLAPKNTIDVSCMLFLMRAILR